MIRRARESKKGTGYFYSGHQSRKKWTDYYCISYQGHFL